MKTCEEEIRQFSVVCRVAIQQGWNSYNRYEGRPNLTQIGLVEFGLIPHQVCRAIASARDDIAEITRLDRVRKAGRVNFPTSSDQLIRKLAA